MSSKYPAPVLTLCMNQGAWIVGSNAFDPSPDRDYDLLIPWHEWHTVAGFSAAHNPVANKFGGWKIRVGRVTMDIWPGDLSWLATQPKFKQAYHPATDTLIVKADKR